MLVLNDDLKFFGSTMVLGGCDDELEPIAGMESSIGAQLRKYGAVRDQEPIIVRGKPQRVKIVAICFTADFEAQGLFGFETESANGHKLCRCCNFDKCIEGAYSQSRLSVCADARAARVYSRARTEVRESRVTQG